MNVPREVIALVESRYRGKQVFIGAESPLLVDTGRRVVLLEPGSVARFAYQPPPDGALRVLAALGLSLRWLEDEGGRFVPPAVSVDLYPGEGGGPERLGSSDFWERFPVADSGVCMRTLPAARLLEGLKDEVPQGGFFVELGSLVSSPVRCSVQASLFRITRGGMP